MDQLAPEQETTGWRRYRDWLNRPFAFLKPYLPRGLLGRSVLIIILPMIILQIIITLIFFERHYELVTRRLSHSVAGEIAMILAIYEADPSRETLNILADTARHTMQLEVTLIENAKVPPARPVGLFNPLDGVISEQLRMQIPHKTWFDADTIPSHVDIRVAHGEDVIRILVRRSRVLATNWHIFLVWMAGSSLLITGIAYGFLRNQIRPILRLAQAAEAFGRGREVPDFRPAGATEIRNAARALIDMRSRLARHIEQRTDMLAGISHDMRTPLTRIKLALALAPESADNEGLKQDVVEMERMLDEYLAFARGEGSERVSETNLPDLIREVIAEADRSGLRIKLELAGSAELRLRSVPVRRGAIKRCLSNLLQNALTYGKSVRVNCWARDHFFEIAVEDDGPGIPQHLYEEAFRPFRRLETGLKSGAPGAGLGLAIARDLARSHGGDVWLSQSELGGLKAAIRLPI